jgi:tetratricopeptide (TPR) repeat protein
VDVGEQVVEQLKRQLGSEHPATLLSMADLAKAFHGDGRVERALQVFQEMLPLCEKVYGDCHTVTLAILDATSEELCNMGKYERSLTHLIDLRQRCDRALGLRHERTILILIDIGYLYKLLNKTEEASTAFSMALDRCRNESRYKNFASAIKYDMRCLQAQPPPDLEQIKTLLRQHGLPIPTEPFPNSKSTTFRETYAASNLRIGSSMGYEVSNAAFLRLGPINGEPEPRPPVFIPPYYKDTTKIALVPLPAEARLDNSFQSLIDRSIAILPRKREGEVTATWYDIDKHIAFLKGLKSLDEFLASESNQVWFFQRRESFMQQTKLQKWDPNCLERYVLLPMKAELVNSEDCIFVSHYWKTPTDPDPEGEGLRQLQRLLGAGWWGKGAYIWVDWTCLPQAERTAPQQQYFSRVLLTIPRLVRDCSFLAQYPEFCPRLWVLFEVAAFIFDRAENVELTCMDTFKKHLLQMKGDGVMAVLDGYGYTCRDKGDRELITAWLEILIALRKVVPSVHTRRQILNAIDRPGVRACTHGEAGVEVDKERGTIKANDTIVQFSPFPVWDGIFPISEHVAGDHEKWLARALQRADESFDDAGVGEIAREYDRMGDYKIAEVLHRRALAKCEDFANSYDLILNLESQERYEEAAAQCRRDLARPGAPTERVRKLQSLEQKQVLFLKYRKWKSQPLSASLGMEGAIETNFPKIQQPAARNGLRRSWLQRLDHTVWQSDEPMVFKSLEESALESEAQGQFTDARHLYWVLLERRKETLGSCHVDTRRSLSGLARVTRMEGQARDSHELCAILLAVCDFTLGPTHPESRAALGDLAATVLQEGKLGVAKGYYRQLLERTLAVAEWDDPETFLPKFFLHALIGDDELRIDQFLEKTTVQIVRRLPGVDGSDAEGGEEPSREVQGKTAVLADWENADQLLHKYIVDRAC